MVIAQGVAPIMAIITAERDDVSSYPEAIERDAYTYRTSRRDNEGTLPNVLPHVPTYV